MKLTAEQRLYILMNDARGLSGRQDNFAAYMTGFEVGAQFALDHPEEAQGLLTVMLTKNRRGTGSVKLITEGLFTGPEDD